MSLFKFIQDAGKKAAEASKAPNAAELLKEIQANKLTADDLDVKVEDGRVTVQGKAKDQAALEKIVLAVGNMFGVKEVVTDNFTVGNISTESTFYTVKSGDTLWKIAEAHYGKGKGDQYNVIFEANKPMLTHPDKIYPGQMLRIPPLK